MIIPQDTSFSFKMIHTCVILFELSQIFLTRVASKFFLSEWILFSDQREALSHPFLKEKKNCCSPIVNNPQLHWLPHPFKSSLPGFTSQSFLQEKQNSKIGTVLDWAVAKSAAPPEPWVEWLALGHFAQYLSYSLLNKDKFVF